MKHIITLLAAVMALATAGCAAYAVEKSIYYKARTNADPYYVATAVCDALAESHKRPVRPARPCTTAYCTPDLTPLQDLLNNQVIYLKIYKGCMAEKGWELCEDDTEICKDIPQESTPATASEEEREKQARFCANTPNPLRFSTCIELYKEDGKELSQ